ncbi:MAG: adenosine deaminase [Candidatus Eremiobacteraeota bacterium]|nr:adenosine deaminase [Candidatus Eremiobacteraeota bacterium]
MMLAQRIPKVHLHCHLEGCLRGATFVELADKYGVPLRYEPTGREWVASDGRPPVDRSDPYRFRDFQEFLLTFAAASRALVQPEDYARLTREFVEDALAQNVMYGELFVSPSVWTFFHRALDVRDAFAAIVAELRAARPHAEFKLVVDLTRNFGKDSALRTARLATQLSDYDVIAVGLGGDEVRFPPAHFAEAFAYARAVGLHCVAHAGEAAGPESVLDAVTLLGAERIGHGIAALHDPAVVERLARDHIALEICPTSNQLTGAALPDRQAFVEFDRAGCVVTIDADDPTMFGTSIEQEYAIVERAAGADAVVRFVGNAIDSSFADARRKQALRARLATELDAARRSETLT